MARKRPAGFLRADEPLDTVEEILFENVGLERRARLARDDEERVFQIDFVLEGLHLSRIGRIEHVKFREPADRAEGRLDYFRTEARSPHSQQQDMGKAGTPGGFSNSGQALDVGQLVVGNAEPSEPLRFVPAAPERRIPAPELSDLALGAPLRQRLFHGSSERLGQRVRQAIEPSRPCLPGLLLHRLQQLPEGVGEELHAFNEQLVGDILHGDPDFGERGHRVSGGLHILHEACARPPVVAKRVEGRRRDRVDGIGPDQLLDVDHVAVVGVLGPRAGPEQPLRLGALAGQGLPAPPAEELLVALVGELGVGNRDLAGQAAQHACLVRIRPRLQTRRDERIDRGINPADEKTGDAGNSLQVAAAGGVCLQARNVSFRHPLVRVLSKQQCHIDVDPLADELVDSGNPLRRRGDFDHQIVAV